MYYDEFFKLCGYGPEDTEREKPRIERAFQILGINTEDIKLAEERVRLYFDIELEGVRKLLGVWIRQLFDLVLAREEGKKIIYTSFPSIPALGLAAALASEDVYCQAPEVVLDVAIGQILGKIEPILEEAEKQGLPPGIGMCSLNQARFGAIVKGIIPTPDLSVVGGFFCDQMAKTEDHLHYRYGYPVVYIDQCYGDSPWDEFPKITKRRLRYFGKETEIALEEMRKVVGPELNEEILTSARHENAKLWFAQQDIADLMKSDPAPLSNIDIGMEFQMVASAERRAVYEGLPAMETLIEEGKQRVNQGKEKIEKGAPKIFFYSHHFTDPSIMRLVEDIGLCMVAGHFHTLGTQDMIKAQAKTYGERRAERMLRFGFYHSGMGAAYKAVDLCKLWNVEGAVLFYHFSCRPMSADVFQMKKTVEEQLSIPVLMVEGDYYDIRSYTAESFRTRLETFAEMLRARKAVKG